MDIVDLSKKLEKILKPLDEKPDIYVGMTIEEVLALANSDDKESKESKESKA